jgi:NADPH-dependent 2,4-dienoyl-CoA reductase/sulfur reductase-like enzyme
MKAWNEEYKGIVEYRPNYVLTDVDVRTLTAKFETADDVKADVLNVIPPHRAGNIAAQAGVITANDRWCEVDFLSFESIKVQNIHVLGDSIQVAPLMPKSGHGEPARPRRRARRAQRAAGQSRTGAQQYVLHVHNRSRCRAYRVGASLRPGKEDAVDGPR